MNLIFSYLLHFGKFGPGTALLEGMNTEGRGPLVKAPIAKLSEECQVMEIVYEAHPGRNTDGWNMALRDRKVARGNSN